MITVASWDRAVKLGSVVFAAFAITSARPIATVTLDAIGDGLPGATVSAPTEGFGGLGIVARRVGTFDLVVEATDTAGCVGRTGVRRPVVVTR